MRNYNSTGSRDPIWTQVTSDPEDGLRCVSQERLQGAAVNIISRFPRNTYDQPPLNKRGLNVITAAIFIAGEMAGSGVLALPRAIVNSGWIGLILLLLFCFNAGYGGTRLGACWDIIEERYPEHRGRTRNPYATIAHRAAGRWASLLVSGCIQFTLFGAGTVYLLLSSQIFQELLTDYFPKVSFCFWFLLIAGLLTPPMWLGSPKDFSTLLFAFGGASTFPTIQNDMENKNRFSVSVIIAFGVVLALYFPVSAGGYFVYGEDIQPNVAMSLSKTSLVTLANILMAIHLIFAFLIVINPVCQELEEIFGVPHYYHWKRCGLRTIIVLVMVLVGETIPKFGKILSLVGGSTITLLTFVFPPYFYMRLCKQKDPTWPERHIPKYIKIYLWELIFIGLVGGTAATYSAIMAIFGSGSMTKPCYWP